MTNPSAIIPEARSPGQRAGFAFSKVLVVLLVWSIMAGLISPVLFYALPDIEARFYPVLTNQKVENVRLTKDGKFQLWDWTYTKNRRGYIDFAAFMAYVRRNEKYTTDVFIGAACVDSFRTSRATPVGDTVTKTLCARLPEPLQHKGPVTIRGYAEYRVGHPLYTVPVLIPPIQLGDPDTLDPEPAPSGPLPESRAN